MNDKPFAVNINKNKKVDYMNDTSPQPSPRKRAVGVKTKLYLTAIGLAAITMALAPVAMFNSGCAYSSSTGLQTNVVNGVTNVTTVTNVTVNQATLAVEELATQGGVAALVTALIDKDPKAVPAIQDLQITLNGVLNGASTNSTAQLVATWQKKQDPALVAELTPLVNLFSSAEQNVVTKLNTSPQGQVAFALAQSGESGVTMALHATGH